MYCYCFHRQIRLRREAFSQESISLSLREVASRLSAGLHTTPKSIQSLCEVVEAVFFYSKVEILFKKLKMSDHSKCNIPLLIS